jgi:hypothetical protein
MLSYKYYKTNSNINGLGGEKTYTSIPIPFININNAIKESFSTALQTNLADFKNPINSNDRRFNIWDNISMYIDDIIDNSFLSEIDKIYMTKLLAELRTMHQVHHGIEYYCLKQIYKLNVFRIYKKLSTLGERISYFITKYYRESYVRRAANFFSRNIRKIQVVKRMYNSRVIFRSTWVDIYECYKHGQSVLFEELNQSTILDRLGIQKNQDDMESKSVNIVGVIPDDELQGYDSDLDMEVVDIEKVEHDNSEGIYNNDNLDDFSCGNDITRDIILPSPIHEGSEADDIIDDIEPPQVLEPDEW